MENLGFIFNVDVDGVLRDNLGEMVSLYNESFNDNKTIDEITDYRTDVIFPRIQEETGISASQWFFQEHSKELFLNAKPYPFMAEDIKTLQKYGKVNILTYQKSYKNKMETLEWLEKNGVEPDGICFMKDKSRLNCTFFIDDNDWNFLLQGEKNEKVNSQHGILIDAPYNKDINLDELSDKSHCGDIKRCGSLHDFVKEFELSYGN